MNRLVATAVRLRWVRPLVFAALALASVAAVEACPSCKAALSSGNPEGDLVGGFFWSILFMLSMPFMVFGGISGYFYYLVRKARGAAGASGPADRREG